jgi:hypothetical protein
MVHKHALDVCNDKLFAPTNTSVTFADNTTLSFLAIPLDNGYPPITTPDPPDLMIFHDKDPEPIELAPDPDCITWWCNRVSTPYCGADLLCTSNVHPPGSLFDPTTPIKHGDLNNFPYLGLKTIPDDDDTNPHPSNVEDIFWSLQQNVILPQCFHAKVDFRHIKHPSCLTNGGANVCITDDPSLLVDVVDIEPVPLGTALLETNNLVIMCTQMGYMPLSLFDGTMHYQPFLINKHAADTIISLEHILNNNHWFASWQQEAHKVMSGLTARHPGSLSFFDSAGILLLSLYLHQQDGVYYCSHTALVPGVSKSAGAHAYHVTTEIQHLTQPNRKPTTRA